jgi:hypothetical protein
MPMVMLRIKGWEKPEDISNVDFARGEVFISDVPPLFTRSAEGLTPHMHIRKYLFVFNGAEKNGLPVFECCA